MNIVALCKKALIVLLMKMGIILQIVQGRLSNLLPIRASVDLTLIYS